MVSQDDVIYFEANSNIALKIGSNISIVWDLDGSLIDAGTAEVTDIDSGVVTATIIDGQPSIGMLVQFSPKTTPKAAANDEQDLLSKKVSEKTISNTHDEILSTCNVPPEE